MRTREEIEEEQKVYTTWGGDFLAEWNRRTTVELLLDIREFLTPKD